jgi:nitroimidazol reductase NimA-like FMN-containing flavoprotein (pyridoxamine 5'-phosphate oxidase superfamily)
MATTASKSVEMSAKEMDDFLARPRVARVATIMKSGAPHISPAWYFWDSEKLLFSFGISRLHVKNLRRDPRMDVIIDQDLRPEKGLKAGAQAVLMKGRSELTSDKLLEITKILLVRYLGPDAEAYAEPSIKEGRIIAKFKPEKIITWDFAKSFE